MYGMVGVLLVSQLAVAPGPERTIDREAADALQSEAIALFTAQDQWKRAATLLEKAAELRDDADPKRSEALRLAAQVYWHFGDNRKAERLLIAAAEASTARGAVLEAAHAYLSAAELAATNGEPTRAWTMVDTAALLAASPHLTDSERQSITERLPARARG